jgi:hypothetical protein
MGLLVIKKDIRLIRPQELGLVQSAEKDGFINANIPGTQRAYDAFMRWRRAGRDQRRPDRCFSGGEGLLQVMQRG